MIITTGVSDGIPKDEIRVTHMRVDLIFDNMINITYEKGVSVSNINITVELAKEIGLIDLIKLEKLI
jgi:hypothetical protein